MENITAIQPAPKRVRPSRGTATGRIWPFAAPVSEFEVLGWEDGAFRCRMIGTDGEPLNNGAVIGINLPQDSTDEKVRAAVEKILK